MTKKEPKLFRDKTNGGYKESLIAQETLLKVMGYKVSSRIIMTRATEALEQVGLIKVRTETTCDTVVKNGDIVSTVPKTKKYYTMLK